MYYFSEPFQIQFYLIGISIVCYICSILIAVFTKSAKLFAIRFFFKI